MLQFFDTLTDDSGNALLGATVTVTAYPSGGAATIYSTNGTAQPIATSTVSADITGQVSFYAPDGAYILTYAYKSTVYKIRSPVQFLDPMGFVAATDTGVAANVYVVTGSQYPAQKYVGLKLEVKANFTNTGASTLNFQTDGGLAINQPGGAALVSGMIQANGLIRIEWDGTQWQLLGSQSQPFYAQTTYEQTAGIVPVSTAYSPDHVGYDVRREGADPTGVADSRAALANAQSVGSQLYFPRGTYKIASNITFTVPLLFDYGAILVPSSGVTITINTAVNAGPWQIFNTVAVGSLIAGLMQNVEMFAEWWGAVGNGATDDTVPLNAALAFGIQSPGVALRCLAKIYVISATLYAGGSASGQTANAVQIRGTAGAVGGVRNTTFKDLGSLGSGVPILKYRCLPSEDYNGETSNLTLDSTGGNAVGIELAGLCGWNFRGIDFAPTNLQQAIHFNNQDAGSFTEFNTFEKCTDFNTGGVGTRIHYSVASGNTSFHGSGLGFGCTANMAGTGAFVQIDSTANPYMSPFYCDLFGTSSFTVFNNQGGATTNFYGHLGMEIGSGTPTLAAGQVVWTGDSITINGVGAVAGTLIRARVQFNNVSAGVGFLDATRNVSQVMAVGANTLGGSGLNAVPRLMILNLGGANYQYVYYLIVIPLAGGNAVVANVNGVALPGGAIIQNNTGAQGAPSAFAGNTSGQVVVTGPAGWSSTITASWSEIQQSSGVVGGANSQL